MPQETLGILLAFAGALFAGAVAILAKLGYTGVDSTLATALRTVVVLVFAWGLAALGGRLPELALIPARSWVFLTLSGLATGASWLFYFAALQKGDVARVAPIDKSSTILTMLLAIPILGEIPTPLGVLCMVVMGAGTMLMVGIRRPARGEKPSGGSWLAAAWASAVFAALTSILTKLGVTGIDSTLGTAVRTTVVLVMAWAMVLIKLGGKGAAREMKAIPGSGWMLLALSGIATGASWLCQNASLQLIDASLAAPIDKLSIVVTILFSRVILKEKLPRAARIGLVLLVAGTLGLLI